MLRKKKKTILFSCTSVIVLLSVLVYSTIFAKAGIKVVEPSTSEEVADFKVQTLEGKEVDIKNFKGKKVFVNLWKTDCLGCVEELPEVFEAAKEKGVEVLAICGIDSADKVKKFCQDKNFDLSKIYLDSNAALLAKYGFTSFPDSLFIDASGKISKKVEGEMTKKEMLEQLDKIPNADLTPSSTPSVDPKPTPTNDSKKTINVVEKKTAKASTEKSGFPVTNANDMNFTTVWKSTKANNQWIKFDLEKGYDLSYVFVFGNGINFFKYNIEVSDTGNTWSTYAQRDYATNSKDNWLDKPISKSVKKGRYVKFNFKKSLFYSLFNIKSNPSIREIAIYGVPEEDNSPNPSHEPTVEPTKNITPSATIEPTKTTLPSNSPEPTKTTTPSNSPKPTKSNGQFSDNMNFELKDLNGKTVSLNNYFGKKIFVNFWATWCGACTSEMPSIEKLNKEEGDNIVILAVNEQESESSVKDFITKNKYTFNVLSDSSGSVSGKYGVNAYPTSVFIDTTGKIQYKEAGSMTYDKMKSEFTKLK